MTSPSTEFSPPKGGQPCPCGTGKTFAVCCQPLLLQQRKAATPEELMRSRFTAHVAHDWAHLHRTFEETANEPYDATEDPQAADWTRLEIHSHGLGPKPGMGYVDFTAHYKEGDLQKTLPEKAEFRNVDGTWLYTGPIRQGPAPVKAAAAKVGRNDPCPCGSGKKYKQCCLK